MDQYLIYLRKSRKDREAELQTGNFDTLERHRSALLRLAKERGYYIADILEEVVTGDTIAERPKMQELLRMVETGLYAGVLVMEVPRLARGKTRDQGIVSETFSYSQTKIITPDKTYDPSNDADEDYFEFGLFMSRQEYRMINKRLNRGRMASLNEGKYIAGAAPYGYEKYKLQGQKGYSLRIVGDQAAVVRRIYQLYIVGLPGPDGVDEPLGSYRIANLLTAQGIPSPGGGKWTATAVRDILKNPTYAGMIRWAYRPVLKQVKNGEIRYSTPVSPDPKLVQGLHEAIIPLELWQQAQELMHSSSKSCVPAKKQMTNPMAGVLYCSECGRSLVRVRASKNSPVYRLMCPTPGCPTVSHRIEEVETALLDSIRSWLTEYKLSAEAQQAQRQIEQQPDQAKALRKSLATLQEQQGRLYDLLEQRIYTQEIFLERSKLLAQRIADAQAAIDEAEAAEKKRAAVLQLRQNIIPEMENLLETYWSAESAQERNRLLKPVLSRVIYEKQPGEPTFRLHLFPRTE